MQKEYGCNELMMDGGYCTSTGDVVCLCDECQRKIIEKIELLEGAKNTEQQVQPDNLPEDGDSDYYDDHGTGK